MFIKIYFEDKPVFLCDKIDKTIDEYMHHPEAIFIDEVSNAAINSLLHEIAKSEFHAGILFDNDFNKLKKAFFKHFDIIIAAGGIVQNTNEDILMIFRRGKWDLPKGKLDKGETLEHCAVREVEEETGLKDIQLHEKITTTYHTYIQFGKPILKESHWYKMKCNTKQKLVPQTEEDITEIKWVSKSDLTKYTSNTYQTILEVLNKL
ncbi:MAG: NUDIX domain-containing protein [Bacteroidota bacterium]|nr:NUDIX domain-containing protein [Bacteroidota bacterium]